MSLPCSPAALVTPLVRQLDVLRAQAHESGIIPLGIRDRALWDDYVRSHPDGSLFHTTAWMESVADAFGHRQHYLIARSRGVIRGVLPMFHVRSRIGGSMLVSVPYSVGGGILADSESVRNDLWDTARRIARETSARTIDLRAEGSDLADCEPVEGYVSFKRELPDHVEDVLAWLPRKARAAARNARFKHGLTVDFDPVHLPTAWQLYCRSMRRLGSICYPRRFFEGLVERFGEDAFVQIVRFEDRVIAALVSFRFGDTFLPYFAGCDERFNGCNTNNFLYLAAMEKAVELGCRVFDFGRTRADNKGSYDFKRFHGFEPKPLPYGRWVAEGAAPANLTPSNPKFRLARNVWRHLPLALSVYLGTRVARHVPG